MLASDGALSHVEWVSAEAATEGLTALLATLWWDTHPLVADLLSLTCHNARKFRSRIGLEAEYSLLPIRYLRCLSLYLNTWYISVEDEGGNIEIPSITAIRFELDRRTFDAPHMLATLVCAPLAPPTTSTTTRCGPTPDPTPLSRPPSRPGRARC